MIVKSTGKVTSELYVMGAIDLPAFLLAAESPVVIDAGMTCMGEQYIREIREILKDRAPSRLFLTHSHYDHCGAAAQIREAFAGIQVCCAEVGVKVFENPRAVATMRDLNRSGTRYMASLEQPPTGFTPDPPDFEPVAVDCPLSDGDVFNLGPDVSLQAIATPGHTRDSMSFYIPERKILFTGEALGVRADNGYIFSEWLSSYEAYVQSMERLTALDVDVLCIAHGCVLTGADARAHMQRTVEYCAYFRDLIEKTLDATGGDVETAKARIKESEYDPLPDPKQPDFAYLINLEAKIRAVQQLYAQ